MRYRFGMRKNSSNKRPFTGLALLQTPEVKFGEKKRHGKR